MLLLFLALLQQAPAPEVISSIDRDTVTVGEEVLFTIRVTSRSDDPVRIVLPPFDGLETIARSERTDVTLTSQASRTTIIELRLRTLKAGRFHLGPFQVLQGTTAEQADGPDLRVTGSPSAIAANVNPRVRRLLERAIPPTLGGKVGLSLAVSADTAMVGEQVDLLTVAWIPRDLRLRLRRPPTLEPPTVQGVWSYPQPVPSGIAASRMVGGIWYDLFVVHQVLFPLEKGEVRISAATLHYSVPVAFQFFSQEERYSLTTSTASVAVRDLPVQDRPPGFTGAVGHRLEVARTVTPTVGRVGEPFQVEITVRGEGNVGLWPAPLLIWPRGVRAYADRTDERESLVDGVLAGSKTFRFLAVPDSAGSLMLPALNYPYFDPVGRSYALGSTDRVSLAVAPSAESRIGRVVPPPLAFDPRAPLAWRLVHEIPWPVGLLVVLLPPLGMLLPRLRRPPRRAMPAPRPSDRLARSERELGRALELLVPDPERLSGEAIERSLRGAGLPAPLAREIVSLRQRLQAARFAGGKPPSGDRLAEEVQRVLAQLGASRVRGTAAGAALLALLMLAPLGSQSTSPEALYQAGAVQAAADGFAAQARAEPGVAAHWYNLGAAEFRLGEDARALAAWTTGLRLAPRESHLRKAIHLVSSPEGESSRWLRTYFVTPEELLLIAALVWIAGWVGLALRPRARARGVVVPVAAAAIAGASLWMHLRYARPVAVVAAESSLRLSPHERSPVVGPAARGAVVLVGERLGGWALVRDDDGRTGWVPLAALAPV